MISLAVVLAAASAGIGCSGGASGTPGTGGGAGTGGGGAAGSGPSCPTEPGVIGCGVITNLRLELTPDGGAFVSYLNYGDGSKWLKSWDASAGGWKVVSESQRSDFDFPWSPIMRVDSQGRQVTVSASRDDVGSVRVTVVRQEGPSYGRVLADLPPWVDNSLAYLQLEIDAMDRPVLLTEGIDGTSASRNKLAVVRWEIATATWTQLGGTTPINATPARHGWLALDSGDGVTPYVAYVPDDEGTKIVPLRFDGNTWSAAPALTRVLDMDFDIAVAGGQMYLAYLDGPRADRARIYLSMLGPSGWSTGTRLDADVDMPVFDLRLLATGPGPQDLMLGWEVGATPDKHQAFVKRAPSWSRVPSDLPLSNGDMKGFVIATRGARDAIVWSDEAGDPPFAGYLELPR